jgi:uncharacterized protein
MLRGEQTPGELKQRTERLHAFASLGEVEQTLDGLIERELVARRPRQPGQKEQRYAQLLGEEQPSAATPAVEAPGGDLTSRIAALEERVAQLEAALSERV